MGKMYSELTLKLLEKVEEQMYSEIQLNNPDKVDALLKIVEDYIEKEEQ